MFNDQRGVGHQTIAACQGQEVIGPGETDSEPPGEAKNGLRRVDCVAFGVEAADVFSDLFTKIVKKNKCFFPCFSLVNGGSDTRSVSLGYS